jgi:translation initiation factor IF-3
MNKSVRINERISATRIRLILANGENKGEFLKHAALNMAREQGLDLVEVSPGTIPVCKIADFGKMMYEKSKSEKHQSHAPSLKEMRFTYNIGDHDLEIKKRKIAEFLQGGHKVSMTLVLKGREKAMRQAAKEKFYGLVSALAPTMKISEIKENGNGYSVLLDPSRK